MAPFATYTPFAELARTRTSTLYLARTTDLHTVVVLRLFDPNRVDDTGNWLLQSTATLRANDHRHWTRLLAFEHHAGRSFWVFEYLHATSLHHTLARANAPLPYPLAAAILLRAAHGAHAAHEMTFPDDRHAHFVHRRITPRTLYVGWDGSVKLMPCAFLLAFDAPAGDPYEYLPYLAPEQVAGEEIDRRCDVYALGLLLYELTMGRSPFAREHGLDTLEALQAHQLPARWHADYPPALEAIVRRALAARRDERHASARELALDLERWLFDAGFVTNETDIAAYVAPLHGDEIARRRALLSLGSD